MLDPEEMGISADEDAEVGELFQMYSFITKFNCSPQEYLDLPFKQSQWLIQIHNVHEEAINEMQERASKSS